MPLRNSLAKIWMFVLLPAFAALLLNDQVAAQDKTPSFHVIVLAEHGGIHKPFVDAAKTWLGRLARENNFTVDYIEDTEKIDDPFLKKYDLFIQLNYPPYNWTDPGKAAFIKYIEQGKGRCLGAGNQYNTPRALLIDNSFPRPAFKVYKINHSSVL